MSPSMGVLFWGPPCCGKTLLAEQLPIIAQRTLLVSRSRSCLLPGLVRVKQMYVKLSWRGNSSRDAWREHKVFVCLLLLGCSLLTLLYLPFLMICWRMPWVSQKKRMPKHGGHPCECHEVAIQGLLQELSGLSSFCKLWLGFLVEGRNTHEGEG